MNDSQSLVLLMATAALLGAGHTIIAPHHYLPFAAVGKSAGWSNAKTLFVTLLCGLGHLASSLVFAGIAVALTFGAASVEYFQHFRGDIAQFVFLGFALAYTVFGLKRGLRSDAAAACSCRCRAEDKMKNAATLGALFLIFLIGPCDVLIPLVIFPALSFDWWGVLLVACVFSLATIASMLLMVSVILYGLKFVPFRGGRLERWSSFITGVVLLVCALLMFAHNHAH